MILGGGILVLELVLGLLAEEGKKGSLLRTRRPNESLRLFLFTHTSSFFS